MRVQRAALGVSQEKVAMAADMDQSQYSRIERAEVDPSVRTLARVARALQVTPAQLMEGVEWVPPSWLTPVEPR
jgi:transcriptional regulator with XRE-family HTH domain